MKDKVTKDDAAAQMARSVRKEVLWRMTTYEESYETARGIVQTQSVAGPAVWAAVDRQFHHGQVA